ncbi:MAG: hypothetical protein SXA11_14480 [Cyanobacteriota bacterium]|nr:hypothetical protein [Cyanobacteriota bacterium]
MKEKPSQLTKWAEKALGLPEVLVQVRLRGNQLHILCEAELCPREDYSVARFSGALAACNIESLLPDRKSPTGSRIYQIFICGRALGARRPDWTVKLDTNGYCPTSASFPAVKAEANKETPLKTGNRSSGGEQLSGSGSLSAAVEEKPLVTSKAPSIGESPTEVTLNPTSRMGAIDREKTAVLTAPAPQKLNEERAIAHTGDYRGNRIPSTVTLEEEEKTEVAGKSPKEIATYLSEVLGGLGISVNVKVEENYKQKQDAEIGVASQGETEEGTAEALAATNFKKSKTKKRLWVICEASYSPDPSLLAEPVAQRLRELKLKRFREALILLQVRGEAKPDWMLRVDLTPSARILHSYARWGDVAAIERILQRKLKDMGVALKATLKKSTLHIFCSKAPNSKNGIGIKEKAKAKKGIREQAPDKEKTKQAIARLLSTLSPQGIQAATLYGIQGQPTGNAYSSPSWIEWLNLPASQHPDLEPSAVTLAKSGNNSALNFLLDRLLNPDLDRKLETGGIKAIVLPKANLLHVMSEAPTCPSQSKVGQSIAEFLRDLELPGITGVRVYGRRAGQKLPLWRYGLDFTKENRSSAEQVPEFAASVADGELSLSEAGVSVVLPGQQGMERKKQTTPGSFSTAIRKLLVASGLFVPEVAYSGVVSGSSGLGDRSGARWVALVWAALGVVLAVQTDFLLGKFLELSSVDSFSSTSVLESDTEQTTQREILVDSQSEEVEEVPVIRGDRDRETGDRLPEIPWQRSGENPEGVFNESGFTKSPNLTGQALRKPRLLTIDYPTFNSKQLDEQLVRYQDYILANNRPPDILIVGSSRALRGIDPRVLEESFAENGYEDLKVYNLGINGATVRVVDLILRQVLFPEQLPRLILFADGVRAFNSGREDRTYEIIASSEGYKAVMEGDLTVKINNEEDLIEEKREEPKEEKLADVLRKNYSKIKESLENKMKEYLVSYSQRDRVKAWLGDFIEIKEAEDIVTKTESTTEELIEGEETGVDTEKNGDLSNGFLPISIKFNPDIYYQNHPLVSGDYDADYSNFKLTGQQTTAFKNLLRYTQAKRVKVVFVNMPLTKEYLDDARSYYELEFREYMKEIVLDYPGLSFRDLSLLWPQAYENFSDPSHLNRYGAQSVAEELAKDGTIPQPKTNLRF